MELCSTQTDCGSKKCATGDDKVVFVLAVASLILPLRLQLADEIGCALNLNDKYCDCWGENPVEEEVFPELQKLTSKSYKR